MNDRQHHPTDTVVSRFPGRRAILRAAWAGSDSFRELCEDLSLCDDAMARWRESEAPVAAARLAECAEWKAELEQEIEQWLDRLQTGTE